MPGLMAHLLGFHSTRHVALLRQLTLRLHRSRSSCLFWTLNARIPFHIHQAYGLAEMEADIWRFGIYSNHDDSI
jgi:hypothetical protein